MTLRGFLSRHGLTLREWRGFLAFTGAEDVRFVEHYDGVRPKVVEIDAGDMTGAYRAHDIRMLAARC